MKAFDIDISCHDQYCIQIYNDGTVEDFQKKQDFLRMAVSANHIESEYYQMRVNKGKPFLQGFSDNEWVLVEFWTSDFDAVEEYVDFLNRKYQEDWNE